MARFELQTPAFGDGGEIPVDYTCDGRDVSPPLDIAGIPDEAKSLALVVDDPDAPNGTFVHWIVYGISSGTSKIPEGMLPPGARTGKNDWGRREWGGPCPPDGPHRYQFHLYALDLELDLPAGATRDELEKAIKGHVLAEATLTGVYERQRAH
jgi:Raf kinase inhibitor-like YbhB/YbcL family protein